MTDPLEEFQNRIENEIAERYAETSYTDSYVAFLDVLGMKKLVRGPYEDLRSVFNAAEAGRAVYSRTRVPGGNQFIGQDHLKMTIMSDSIVLSIDSAIDQAFSKLVGFSSYVIQQLIHALEKPVFLRGGIVRGEIYQDGATVFGPGLVAAYDLEDNQAGSMRCIISPELSEHEAVKQYLQGDGCALIVDPEDDLHFIDFVREDNRDKLAEIAAQVSQSNEADDVKEKYEWLGRYLDWRLGA